MIPLFRTQPKNKTEEESYIRSHIEALTQLWFRRVVILATLLWAFFILPDLYHSKELAIEILPYRVSVIAFLIIALFLNKISRNNNYQYILIVAVVGFSAAFITVISLKYSAHEFVHLIAQILVLMSVLGFAPMGFKRALFMVGVVYALYSIPVAIFGEVRNPYTFFIINSYIVSATVLMLILRASHQENLINLLKLQYQREGTITKQKSKIKTSQMMFENLTECATEGIVITDNAGVILSANKKFCQIHNITSKESLIGRNIVDIYTDKQNIETMKENMRLPFAQGRLFEITLCANNREKIVAEINMSAFNIEGGEGVLAFYRDVTERKLLCQQLINIQKVEALSNLACGIAHDFKNVLAMMVSYIDLMRRGMDGGIPLLVVKENTDMLENEVERAKELLSNLFKIGARNIEKEFGFVDVNSAIRATQRVYSKLFPSVTIKVDLQEVPVIKGAQSELEQVLNNLLVNAKDAMPNGGIIRIKTEKKKVPPELILHEGKISGDYVCISVSDTGIGIPEESLPHIFEPFYTLKQSDNPRITGGVGLGLTVVYSIITMHKGVIVVNSKVSQGTTFHIYLPVAVKTVADPDPKKGVRPQ